MAMTKYYVIVCNINSSDIKQLQNHTHTCEHECMYRSDEDSLSEIALSGASKLASTYCTLFYRSVHVLYTGIDMC